MKPNSNIGTSHPLGATFSGGGANFSLFSWEPLDFELPPCGQGAGNPWRRWIDTALETPQDIVPWEKAPAVPGLSYRVEARSVVALYAPA